MKTRIELTEFEDYMEEKIYTTFISYFWDDPDLLDDIIVDLVDELMDVLVTSLNEVEK